MNFELNAEQMLHTMNIYAQTLRYNGMNQEEVRDFVHIVCNSAYSPEITREQFREIEAKVLKQVEADFTQQEVHA